MLQLRYADYWLSAGMHEQKLRAQHVLRPKAEPERLLMLRDYPYKLLWISYFFCLISVINFHSLRWSAQLITQRLCTPSACQIYIINNIKANLCSKSFHFLPTFALFSLNLSPQFFIFIPLFCHLYLSFRARWKFFSFFYFPAFYRNFGVDSPAHSYSLKVVS